MTGLAQLQKEWVEIREENTADQFVFRPFSYPIPPARGRRALDLSEPGKAWSKSPGPSDKLEGIQGTWVLEEGALILDTPGWRGTYDIEELTEDKLVLRAR